MRIVWVSFAPLRKTSSPAILRPTRSAAPGNPSSRRPEKSLGSFLQQGGNMKFRITAVTALAALLAQATPARSS
jgi:hypothetical protein